MITADYYSDNDDLYMDEVCPYCGSDALIEYEDLTIYKDDNLEHESEYECTCSSCGKNF